MLGFPVGFGPTESEEALMFVVSCAVSAIASVKQSTNPK